MDEHKSGWTPLRFAMYLGRQDIAARLLDQGADIEAPLDDTYHQYGFHVKGATILTCLAFLHDDPDSIRFLVDRKADPMHENSAFPGTLATHVALDQGRFENARLLLSLCPASWEVVNLLGVTPGHISLLWGHLMPEKVQQLAQGDLTCMGPQISSWGGLNYAGLAVAGAGDVNVLKAVLAASPDINHKVNPSDMSWLTWALFKSCKLSVMVRKKPSLLSNKFANMEGATPLMLASFAGNVPCVELLLESKASVDEVNVYGRTAMSLAAMLGHTRVVASLIKAGANCAIRDKWGHTAAGLAQSRGHTDTSQLFSSRADLSTAQGFSMFQCWCETSDPKSDPVLLETVQPIP